MIKASVTIVAFLALVLQPMRGADVPGPIIGIGTEIKSVAGHPVVANVIQGSPADKAGVKPDDRLTKINDKSVDGLSLQQIAHLLHGDENSKVHLTIDRNGRTKDFQMKREILFLPGTRPASMP